MTVPRSRRERNIFVDTSAFFAFLASDELQHAAALATFRRAGRDRSGLYTTNFVVAETHALALARIGRAQATAFLASLADAAIDVIRATAEDEEAAKEIVFRYTDKSFSLTDAISFAVMERLGLKRAFSFDRDFVQYGFLPAYP
jgi:hypothetical protein